MANGEKEGSGTLRCCRGANGNAAMGVGGGGSGLGEGGPKVTTTVVASQTWELFMSFARQIHTAAFALPQNVVGCREGVGCGTGAWCRGGLPGAVGGRCCCGGAAVRL